MERYPNGYIAVVEGAIPTADDGMALHGRRTRLQRRRSRGLRGRAWPRSRSARAPSTAARPAAERRHDRGGRGRARSSGDAPLINLPGCPVNVDNLTATIVHYLTFKELPGDRLAARPLFAYGGLLHNQCERRAHFEFGEFAIAWGDEGAQKGWCLYKMGCKGPETFANCPTVRYADGTSWPVKAGHGCIGCTMPGFWDAMGPAYSGCRRRCRSRRTSPSDQIGLALVGGRRRRVTAVHGGGDADARASLADRRRRSARRRGRRAVAERRTAADGRRAAAVAAPDSRRGRATLEADRRRPADASVDARGGLT